jgi:hypothetical protein
LIDALVDEEMEVTLVLLKTPAGPFFWTKEVTALVLPGPIPRSFCVSSLSRTICFLTCICDSAKEYCDCKTSKVQLLLPKSALEEERLTSISSNSVWTVAREILTDVAIWVNREAILGLILG